MLTQEEKDYLFKKLESRKKKKFIEEKNDIYKSLKGEIDLTNELFIKVLNSLEYSFKKKLKEGSIKLPIFLSIYEKLPETWIGVKYSNLKQRKKKISKKPNINNTKDEIINYLKTNNINFDKKSNKKDLILLLENRNILNFSEYNYKD